MVVDVVFYLFASVASLAALMVVGARNPVHSVMFLVLTFFSTAGVFVLLQAEFLAAILVMVYMGAVAMLFLFVVMMLDVDFDTLRQGMVKHMPLGITVGLVVLVELAMIALTAAHGEHGEAGHQLAQQMPNTLAIGRILYSRFLYPFEVASLILLVAMIGAIVLTLRKRPDAKRQHIPDQLARTRDEAMVVLKVKSGEGAKR